MSRKKYQENEITLGDRLRKFRKSANKDVILFSKILGVSQASLSDYENNKTIISANAIIKLKQNTDINIEWFLTGEGEMVRKEREVSCINKEEDEDTKISELIAMTQEILKSDTDYALNLAANIKSFHKSVQLENEVHALKSRVSKIEGILSASADEISKEDTPS